MNYIFLRLIKIGLRLIPKNAKYIYLKQSMPYKDNISAILDEMIRNGTIRKYRVFLHGDNLKAYESSRVKVLKPNSITSIWHYLRSKFVLFDNGLYGSIYTKNQISVNVTHGMLCKTYGYLSQGSFPEREKYSFVPHRTATHAITTSPFFCDVFSAALGVPVEDIYATGLPRNDYLLENNDNALELFNKMCSKYKKNIIWMPTYRTSDKALSQRDGADYEFGIPLLTKVNMHRLNDYLAQNQIGLIIKYHTLQNKELKAFGDFNNIIFIDSDLFAREEVALYSFLKHFDALISDYSSVFYDYILLNRPICHIVDDYEQYASSRGFAFENAISLLPGQIVFSYDELLHFIKNVSENIDEGKEKREKFAKQYETNTDSNNARRLLERIGIL